MPEVWVEKEALLDVVQRGCSRWGVPFFACRGFASDSSLYEAGQRMRKYSENGQYPVVFHLGDHDPSGMDMTRDNHDRISLYASHDVKVIRIGLSMEQVEQYNPPPNFAKESDTRYEKYKKKYGSLCWELDALSPQVITGLIDKAITGIIDLDQFNKRTALAMAGQAELKALVNNYADVIEWLN